MISCVCCYWCWISSCSKFVLSDFCVFLYERMTDLYLFFFFFCKLVAVSQGPKIMNSCRYRIQFEHRYGDRACSRTVDYKIMFWRLTTFSFHVVINGGRVRIQAAPGQKWTLRASLADSLNHQILKPYKNVYNTPKTRYRVWKNIGPKQIPKLRTVKFGKKKIVLKNTGRSQTSSSRSYQT